MRAPFFFALAVLAYSVFLGAAPVKAASLGRYEVFGVDQDDMLKMRAGPGTGYKVMLGLPNGTILMVHSCQLSGSTNWCSVSLDQARKVKGYVSMAYLRKI